MLGFLCDYKIDIMDIWSLQNNLKNLSWMDIILPAILENSVHRGAMVLGSTKVILQEPQWDSNEKKMTNSGQERILKGIKNSVLLKL